MTRNAYRCPSETCRGQTSPHQGDTIQPGGSAIARGTLRLLLFVAPLRIGQASVSAQDRIEFLSGAASEGTTVVQIRKASREAVFETKIANRTVTRTYPYTKIHAVT
jgi:hypothetical protein